MLHQKKAEKKHTISVRAAVLLGLLALVVAVFAGRLLQWQLHADSFTELSAASGSKFMKIPALRGEILDTNGNVLAGNRTVYNVRMNAITMEEEHRNETILAVLEILKAQNEEWVDMLPIYADSTGYHFYDDREKDVTYLKGKYMLNMQPYATANDCVQYMQKLYKTPEALIHTRQDLLDLLSVRYYMHKLGFSVTNPYTIAEDISEKTVAILSENAANLPGIEIYVSTRREYPNGTVAPHLVGEIFGITQEQYEALTEEERYSLTNLSGYTLTDKIGQSGTEAAFEDILRGENGKEILLSDEKGEYIGTQVVQNPTAGDTVVLTLNADLQTTALQSLEKNVRAARASGMEKQAAAIANGEKETEGFGEDCKAGAAVVLDISDFSVLAAATYPSYDLARYTSDRTYLNDLYEDETQPLFNRAFRGAFTPGSVFKPAVAVAALEENVITPQTSVKCTGIYEYYEDYTPECMGIHGNIRLREAIAHSCNIYFYDVGRQLTITPLAEYARRLGLGVKTGVEVAESSGTMSDPAEYRNAHGAQWTDGLTIQTAIGQCDNAFTPLQLAAYTATIANNGVRLRTHLLKEVQDYTRTQTVKTYEPQVETDLRLSPETVQSVQAAMHRVQTEGTAASVFGNYAIAIGAKTGTAEVPGHSDNVTFIAFAPYDQPEIAVAVVLEYGASGAYSMAVAKDIFDAYFGVTDPAPAGN